MTSNSKESGARPLPQLTELNRPYWTGGATGKLYIQLCRSCHRLIHPPAILCPDDHSPDLHAVPVSGRGTVESWTENLHSWFPSFPAPYFLAYVVLDDDSRVRVLTNLVNVVRDDLKIGMPVRVTFERYEVGTDEIFLPLFEPDVDS